MCMQPRVSLCPARVGVLKEYVLKEYMGALTEYMGALTEYMGALTEYVFLFCTP